MSVRDEVAQLRAESEAKPRRAEVRPGAPAIRTGEDAMTSRGFSLLKAAGYVTGRLSADECKVEVDCMRQFTKAVDDAGCRHTELSSGTLLMPFGSAFLPEQVTRQEGYKTFRKAWDAGMEGFDADELRWLKSRYLKANQSSLDDALGGTLVAPPVQGELIDLVRPKEPLLQAGATSVPLPPNGRVVYPAATSPTTAYWVGENQSITDSAVGTGQVSLMAKKLAVLVKVPNELFRFASVAADALIRNDASKSLALGLDYAAFYGSGALQPKGLVSYTGTNQVIDYAVSTPTPAGVATNGNTLRPEDGFKLAGLIEDRNFEFSGWIMRPLMWGAIASRRADALTAADNAGQFVQSQFRELGAGAGNTWCGYGVTKSAVIRGDQVKGSSGATLTEVWGGQWEHYLLGMYGAIEVTTGATGDTQLATDQTHVRVLMLCDGTPRYPGAFGYYKQLLKA